MSDPATQRRPSLLERAANVYDFDAAFRTRDVGPRPIPADAVSEAELRAVAGPAAPVTPSADPQAAPRFASAAKPVVTIDPARFAEQGLLVPGAPVNALAEEFRLVKRQLLLTARAVAASHGTRARAVLVSSANAHEGKTYCAINLALSLAAEREIEVVLVDADVAKPDVLARLGLEDRPGLLDVLADPTAEVEDYIVRTNVPQLSLLPAGTRSNQDTELLASARTPQLLDAILAADPRRIIVFDSPPALAASPAATLALHVGQIMLVVRADRTSESDLREAVALLDGCEQIQLVLNAVAHAPGGRRFGSYYGMEDA
ncbi:MAG: exopolysaccharide biosynthesis protein [Sphingobium sp.]|nr:exopolysaccharide biosynthesis protein [Sphingobium sp.]